MGISPSMSKNVALARCVEKTIEQDKALALTSMFCRLSASLMSEKCYGVNTNGYAPVVTVTPFASSREFLAIKFHFADQNSALGEQHTAKSMKPFITHLSPLLIAKRGTLEQPKGTKDLILEFDPAAMLVLCKGIVGTYFPRCETAHTALACLEHKITQ